MVYTHIFYLPYNSLNCPQKFLMTLPTALLIGGLSLSTPHTSVTLFHNQTYRHSGPSVTAPLLPAPASKTTGQLTSQAKNFTQQNHLPHWVYLLHLPIGTQASIHPYLHSFKRYLWAIYYMLSLFRLSVMSDSFATPWTVAHKAPLSMGFSRQEFWSGLPFPPPRDLSGSGIKRLSPALAGGFFFFFYHWATWEDPVLHILLLKLNVPTKPIFPFPFLLSTTALQAFFLFLCSILHSSSWRFQKHPLCSSLALKCLIQLFTQLCSFFLRKYIQTPLVPVHDLQNIATEPLQQPPLISCLYPLHCVREVFLKQGVKHLLWASITPGTVLAWEVQIGRKTFLTFTRSVEALANLYYQHLANYLSLIHWSIDTSWKELVNTWKVLSIHSL